MTFIVESSLIILLLSLLTECKYKFGYEKLKKNGACVFFAPVFFLSLLAGKFDKIEQHLP